MTHFVGLDVSKHTTAVCVLDKNGAVVEEAEIATEPAALIGFLRGKRRRYSRIGFESVSFASWLYEALAKAGLPAICVDARHAHNVLKARLNKTDRNDARGIAEIMRVGLFKAVHMKTAASRTAAQMLTIRAFIHRKKTDVDNLLRATLLQLGLKLPPGRGAPFQKRLEAMLRRERFAREIVAPLLALRATLAAQAEALDRIVADTAERDAVCRRLMTAPGVGALIALTYRASVDIPERFHRSRSVGVYFGLTPRTDQSGEREKRGCISRWGDRRVRSLLFIAARTLMRKTTRDSDLKIRARALADRRGYGKAIVAAARQLAVVLHRMWLCGQDFRFEGLVAQTG